MSIELTTNEIRSEKIFYDGFAEQSVDSDISLPDYCPDIMRILKCTVQTNITNSKISGDRATADCNSKIRVIYSDEKNNICCYDTDYPFSKYAELSSAYDGAVLTCTAKTDYINCRAVSKRRIDIHGVVSLHFTVCSTDSEKIISSAAGDGIQLKRKGIDASSVTAVTSKSFQFSETEEIGDGAPGIGKIMNTSASPVLTETKIIKGKILLKGEVCIKVLYCTDSGENETAELNCSLPFNEIAEAADFTDECLPETTLNITQLSAEPKTDNDGEYRYMNISGEVCASVRTYLPVSVNVITDAYSTQSEIDSKYNLVDFIKVQQSFSEGLSCRQSLDISSLSPEKLYACIAAEPQAKSVFSDGKISVKGKIPLCIIFVDSEGVPVSCEREAEFEFSRLTDSDSQKLYCSPNAVLTGYSCALSADGKIDFKAEMNISAVIKEGIKEKVMTDLNISEGSLPKEKKSSFTVYFCSGKESLWDIARRYNTTVEEIMEENELSADYLENKTVLMIPVK